VIAADWRIDDLSTMLLLALVHESLAKGAGAAEALAAAQRRMQTEPGAAMAARGYRWLGQCAQELTPDEQAYVREKLDALAASGKAAVFADPVYWAPFSASAECFRLEREARALASGAGR